MIHATTQSRPLDLALVELDPAPSWELLLFEVRSGTATVLVSEALPGRSDVGRIVVRRADRSVWEANPHQAAARWSAEEVRALDWALFLQEERAARLRAEVQAGRPRLSLGGPTWDSLLQEVRQRSARLLDAGERAGRLERVIVRRSDGSVWEAVRLSGEPGKRAIRWTDFEIETLLPEGVSSAVQAIAGRIASGWDGGAA